MNKRANFLRNNLNANDKKLKQHYRKKNCLSVCQRTYRQFRLSYFNNKPIEVRFKILNVIDYIVLLELQVTLIQITCIQQAIWGTKGGFNWGVDSSFVISDTIFQFIQIRRNAVFR